MKKTMLFSLLLMSTASQLSFTTEVDQINCTDSDLSVSTSGIPDNCIPGVKATLIVTVTGGVPNYTVELTDQPTQVAPGPDFIFPNLDSSKNFMLKVTDSEDCEITETPEIAFSDLSFIAVPDLESCDVGAQGIITVTVTGGAPLYVVEVTDQPSQEARGPFTFPNLEAGVYQIIVTDQDNCIRTDFMTVPDSLSFTTKIVTQNCEIGITVMVSGGFEPYTVEVTDQPTQKGTGPFPFPDLAAGVYQITVTDQDDCIRTDSETVPESLDFTTKIVPQNCEVGDKGSITVNVIGGLEPYTVKATLDNVPIPDPVEIDPNTFIFPNLEADEYEVKVTDNIECERTDDVTVPFSDLDCTIKTTPQNFEDGTGGTITVTVTGGQTPYTVKIESTETSKTKSGDGPTFVFDDLDADEYKVIVSDSSDIDVECTRTKCEIVLSDNDIFNFILLKYCSTGCNIGQ